MSIHARRDGVTPPLGGGRLAGADQRAARFHRESDRRLRRIMARALFWSAVAVAGVLLVVAFKVQQVRLSYSLDALRTTRANLDELNRRLGVELATLSSPARIEGKARTELGMVTPTRAQVRLAREFVTDRSGWRVEERRTALIPRPAATLPP